MKYTKLGFQYLFKNLWYVFLIWLLPSIFLGLCCNPFQIIEFMNSYANTPITNFSSIFDILMPFSWSRFVLGFLAVILFSIFLSLCIGQMENHMRSGKLNFKNSFSYVNNNILVVLINVLLLALLYVALIFVLGSVLFLFHLMLSGLSNKPTVINVIIAIILCCAIIVLIALLIVIFLINIPNMISNGYSLKEGLSSTISLIGSSTFRLICAYLIPCLIAIPLVSLLCRTNALWAANIVSALITNMYFACLTMTSYFDLSNTSRYDNRKYYNYK